MRQMNERAWKMLDEHEQMALGLQLGYSKSSWQAGEIIGRSHYKYLEIKYRAEHFLKLFTEQITMYGEVIPREASGDKMALEYFRLCVEKRLKPHEAIAEMNNKPPDRYELNIKLINQIAKWNKSADLYDIAALNLVKDFDRWNNFRILPKEVQEPSAYKRRVKNVFKRQLRAMAKLPSLSVTLIEKKFKAKKKPCLYLPILIKKKSYLQPKVIPIKTGKTWLGILDEINLYYFDEESLAKEYIDLASVYLNKTNRECTDGLDFWPKCRELLKMAKNYEKIHNITPQRKLLEMAISKLQYL